MSLTAIVHRCSSTGWYVAPRTGEFKKLLKIMKLTAIFLLVACLQVSANGFSQTITLNVKDAPLEQVFASIKKQSGYSFVYAKDLGSKAKPVTMQVSNAGIETVLQKCFAGQPFTYKIINTVVVVNTKDADLDAGAFVKTGPPPITVRGKITNENGEPVVATVTVKGTNNSTTSNSNGEYVLNNVAEKATLVFSAVNIEIAEHKVNSSALLNVIVTMKVKESDEVVVAYNKTTMQRNVSSLTVVKGEQIQTLPNRSFDKSLQGLVPGLLVTNGSGLPGGPVTNFVLRGIATAVDPAMGSTVRNPLIVVDGIPVTQDQFQMYLDQQRTPISNPLAQLNPSDIETISVLKDAAAISLYGAKAANGVIVIVTKRGKSGKTNFNFRHQTDIASRLPGNVNVLNQQQYLELLFEAYRNLQSPLYPNDAAIYADLRRKFPVIVNSPGDTSFYPAPDWSEVLLRDKATTISNELSMSGGNEKNNYYLNVEYSKQNGIVIGTDYDRKSLRFNFETRPTNWLKLGLNNTLSYTVQNYGNGTRGYAGTVVNNMSPLNPVRYRDGSYVLNFTTGAGPQSASLYANPAAAAEYNINRNRAFRVLTNFNGEINFLKYFRFNSVAGVDFMLTESKEKADPRLVDPGNFSVGIGRIEEYDLRRAGLISTNILRYIRTIHEDHAINVLLGQEGQIQMQKTSLIAVQNLTLPYYDQINSPGVTPLRQTASGNKETLLSFFSQVNYSYKGRYLFSGSIRRDGSSRFGEDRRYGTFWSAGAGWILSSEQFLKNVSWLNYLKIRGSVGAAGNAGAINAATRFDMMDPYRFLGEPAVVQASEPGNPDVHWEQTFSWDAGLEARFWNDRINISADVYKRRTKDLIYPVNLVASTGFGNVLRNIGIMNNQGVELSLSANIVRQRNFNWVIQANWSTNKNKLVKANIPTAALANGILGTVEGRNFNSFYMLVWAGVNPANGNPRWLDSAGNMIDTYSSAVKHKKFVGKPQPDGFGAFSTRVSYKALELSANFYYQYGYQVYIQDDLVSDGRFPYMNQDKRALDRWQKPGDIASNPRRVLNSPTGSAVLNPSTRYLFDGDHIRLQNVAVAYTFPKTLTDRIRMTSLKVFIQGNNLAIWTKYPGQDPDIITTVGGTGNNSFPSQRSFSFGINAGF